MLYYVIVTSTNPAEDHESGFVTQQAAQEYAQDLLAVYLQRLDRDKQHRRSEKDHFAAWARYRLASTGRLTIDSFWADIIGLRSIVISEGSTGDSVPIPALPQVKTWLIGALSVSRVAVPTPAALVVPGTQGRDAHEQGHKVSSLRD